MRVQGVCSLLFFALQSVGLNHQNVMKRSTVFGTVFHIPPTYK